MTEAVNRSTLNVETALYGAILALALGLRLLNLGSAPLTEYEASFALQAYHLAQGQPVTIGSQPFYVIATGLIFAVIKDSNALARLLPALMGASLALLPIFFLSSTASWGWSRWAGLVLAVGLALDPALVALSRLAGSPILAIASLLLAIGFAWQGRAAWAGVLAGLALLSGPSLIQGFLGLGWAWGAAYWLSKSANGEEPERPGWAHHLRWPYHLSQGEFWRTAVLFIAGTVGLGGMLWLRLPQGLAGFASTIPLFLSGWLQPSGIPAFRLPAALLLYQPAVVIFGLVASARAWLSPQPAFWGGRFLSLWGLAALVVSMIYPARQVVDAAWVLIPLWTLAALEVSRYSPSRLDSIQRLPGYGLAGLVALLLVLVWYNLLRLGNLQAQPVLYAAIVGGLVLMVIIVVTLVALGWSTTTARMGLAWGFGLVAVGYMAAAMWGASQVRLNHPAELWTIAPGTGQTDELIATLDEVSAWQHGLLHAVDISVTIPSQSLVWTLRGFPQVENISLLAPEEQPAVIITQPSQENPSLSASYRGQALVWTVTAAWQGLIPPNLLRWLTYREMPVLSQQLILWVRSDLFPGSALIDSAIQQPALAPDP